MAEYIEREAKCKNCAHFDACVGLLKTTFPKITDEEIDIVANRTGGCPVYIPAADVVEVVRCKDCKYFHLYHENDTYCSVCGLDTPEERDFCSYGIRREREC